jgi:ABC-type Fe3+-hydroxamate transport system substrate-binding protein
MATASFSDQMGFTVPLSGPPRKIISLVPSQTELLAELGLDSSVIGITKFCVHPSRWLKEKTIVGGTKKFHFETIAKLKPDLIIGNKEENYQEGIERLRQKYPVWMSDIVSIGDALSMIESVGMLTGKQPEARLLITQIGQEFSRMRKYKGQSVLYMIWRDPWMAVAQHTFINDMLKALNLMNVLQDKQRYPVLTVNELARLSPQYIFLSSEPYPFKESHISEIQQISPSSKILLVDGEMFSWYGSRIVKAPLYFNTLALD